MIDMIMMTAAAMETAHKGNTTVLVVLAILCTMTTPLRISGVNCRRDVELMKPYIYFLATFSDVIVLSEHAFYPCEMRKLNEIHADFMGIGVTSKELKDEDLGVKRGHGGCAVLWRKNLSSNIARGNIKINSDRLCAVQYIEEGFTLTIVSIYLPHQSCVISKYETEVIELERVCTEYNSHGPVLAIGDSNAHIAGTVGSRTWGRGTKNGSLFINAMMRSQMTVVDITDAAYGPTYTFSGGNGLSYIDHICISNDYVGYVSECCVLEDHLINPSDHLAVFAAVEVPARSCRPKPMFRKRVAWDKHTVDEINELYQAPLEKKLTNLMSMKERSLVDIMENQNDNTLGPTELEVFVDDLTRTVNEASGTLKQTKFSKALKPYWNVVLSELIKKKKATYRQWVNAGRPRDENNLIWKEYKCAKKEFRRCQREAIYNYEISNMEQLAASCTLDQRYFWYTMNKNKLSGVSPIRDDKGVMLTDPDQVRNEWTAYYRELYKESANPAYDNEFKKYVDTVMERIGGEGNETLTGGPITIEDINSLKLLPKKAPGIDSITAEHVIYGGESFKGVIAWLLNGIINTEFIPPNLKKGLMSPIPKQDKDQTLKDNNRGITLLPIFYKMLENIMIMREKEWIKENTNSIQSAGIEKCSSLHTSFIVQEAVAHYNSLGMTVYIGSLDGRKAFDTVWINGLLFKCYEKGMNMKMWRLIKNGYNSFQCAVYIQGERGEWFMPMQGVHQGAPLSMILYIIYNNDLLEELRSSGYGLKIGDQDLTSPAHADDVMLLALYKSCLIYLLAIAYEYSKKWRYDYNYDKCLIGIFGEDLCPSVVITMGGQELDVEKSIKHMGVKLCTEAKARDKDIEERIGKGQSVLCMARGTAGSIVSVPPICLSKIYWAAAVPKVIYGLEITYITHAQLNKIEQFHRQCSKKIQRLPESMPNPTPLALAGWRRMEAVINTNKILFLTRTISEETEYKNLAVHSISKLRPLVEAGVDVRKRGPIAGIMMALVDTKLYEIFMDRYDAGNVELSTMKVLVKDTIMKQEENTWIATSILYGGSVKEYALHARRIKVHPWWKVVQKLPQLLVKCAAALSAMMGAEPVGLYVEACKSRCRLCGESAEDQGHILFQCEALVEARARNIGPMIREMPEGMWTEFRRMSNKEAAFLLMNALHCDIVPEWIQLYKEILGFIHSIYKERKEMYSRLEDRQ